MKSTLRSIQWHLTATAFVVIPLLALALSATEAVAGIGIELLDKQPAEPVNSAAYRALVIGNNQYHDPAHRWQPLKTAVSGARAIADLVKTAYHFQDVTVLTNATRSDILHALSDLTRRVDENDSVLLYYAGHGYLDKETNKGYWVPVDAVGDDDTTFLRNSTIRDELNTIARRARHTLLISDSCFSGSLLRGVTRGPVPDINRESYYQQVAQKKSVQIITAGGVEFVDDNYADSGQSPFTYFLLNELGHNNQPVITASELSTNVEKAVSNNSSQVPESGVLTGAGDELGEFIFLKMDINVDVKGIPRDKVKVQVHVTPSGETTKQEVSPADKTGSQPTGPSESASVPLPTL